MADKQATDLVILDIRPVSKIADFFVIGSAQSVRQIKAVQDAVADEVLLGLGTLLLASWKRERAPKRAPQSERPEEGRVIDVDPDA